MSEDDRLGVDTACPYCGKEIDAATGLEKGTRPYEGCFSICIDCGGVSVFGADLRLRERSPDDVMPPELARQIAAVRGLILLARIKRALDE